MAQGKAFLIINEEKKPVAYNDTLLSLLSLHPHKNTINQLERFIKNNPELSTLFHQQQNASYAHTSTQIKIRLLDHAVLIAKIQIYSIKNNSNEQYLLVNIDNNDSSTTESVNLERSLRYNVINKLASSIAHEIRNPLSSLAIHTEVLDNTLFNLTVNQNEKQKIKKSIRIINSELNRVSKIIDQFFNLARSNGNEMKYEDINKIILEIIDLIKQQCYEQGIKVNVSLEKQLPYVHIFRNQIIQALLNIIINSLEAMPGGGRLLLSTVNKDNDIHIIIKDSGCGMDHETKDRLFDLYYSTKENGGGIGLALSNEIIKRQHGQIFVKSNEGVGSTFTVVLPQVSNF